MGQAGVEDQNMDGSGRRMRSNMNGSAGVGDQNMNGSGMRMRSDMNNGSGRSRRSELEWVRQE